MSVPAKPLIKLTAKQIRELHEFLGDMDDECEIGISIAESSWTCAETQEVQAPGIYAWDEEYPEEGVYGPLGGPPAFVAIFTKEDDPRFAPHREIFPYDAQEPKKRCRMSWDEFQALASCRTPAFNAIGEGKSGEGETIAPFRFLSEFDIRAGGAFDNPGS